MRSPDRAKRNGRAERTELSFGQKIIQRLKHFTEVLESGEDIRRHFRVTQLSRSSSHRYDAKQVKQTRKLIHAEIGTFASLLGVSPRTVRAWERGLSHPQGPASRFMDEIQRDPEYWIKRLKKAAVVK